MLEKRRKRRIIKREIILLDEILEEKKSTIGVSLSFYFLKAWKNYDLEKTFLSREELVDDFATCLRSELKQKLEAIGKIGRIVGESLKELVLYGTLEKENFLGKNNKTFSQLTKNYATVEKNEDFIRNFIPGPAVDLRPESVFPFPSSVESDPKLFLGRTENETNIGLLPNASFPILIAGDKKTREISTCRILEQEKKFIILDPRSNLEFEDRIKKPFKSLKLGENFFFNVLFPSTSQEYISEEISSQYLGNFIDLVRSITETRSDTSVLLKDLIDFYVNEYQEEQEEIIFPKNDTPVSLNDLYSLLTIEPGGLVINDYQLTNIKALINEIRDPSVSENTRINNEKGIEQLFKENVIIDFSSKSYKIQKLFLYSFLLQLTVVEKLVKFEEEIIIYIDDAELFFSKNIDRTVLPHIIKKLENSPFKIIFSTPYPSQLSPSVFDLTYNRIVGNLKSASCHKLLSESHGLNKEQKEFIRRLPKNNFLLMREDLAEKPILLSFYKEDIERHETQLIRHKTRGKKQKQKREFEDRDLKISIEDYTEYHPIMLDILEKLTTKVNRGINTESLENLFPQWPKEKVKETSRLLEAFGYIFFETVDKRGRKGEYWTRITPRGKKFLEKMKFAKLVSVRNKELENEEEKSEPLSEMSQELIDSQTISTNIDEEAEERRVLDTLQKIRKVIRETRDSEDEKKEKLEILDVLLTEVSSILDINFIEEQQKLEKFSFSLQEILTKDSLEHLPEKTIKQIFQKALSLIDSIQIKATFG
ncbi:MAG: hypothetical protein ACTSSG_14540, partial [Candidatus Heimdallarchaeaceae archaeon]